MDLVKLKLKAGKGMHPVTIGIDERNIFFSFDYSKLLVNSMKQFKGYRYYGFPDARQREYVLEHFGTDKVWSAPINQRNTWFFQYLCGNNPYAHYKTPWESLDSRFPLWDHQTEMAGFILARKCCIVAGDMATGKTLAVFAALENIDIKGTYLYVCPRFVKDSVLGEINKWKPLIAPNEIISYHRLRIRDRKGEFKHPPQILVLDEAHGLKDPASLQSRAAQKLADWGREVWGDDFYCILMSGTPSPNEPSDWWNLCEIARPGYLAEINEHRLKDRLAVMEEVDHGSGPHKEVKQWLDRDGLCRNCGKSFSTRSTFPCCKQPTPAKNEVIAQHNRLKDRLVYFVNKSVVMDLPDLRRHVVRLEPDDEVMDLARGYIAVAQNGADALNVLRQVSDGFRYENIIVGEEPCVCDGGLVEQFVPAVDFLPSKPEDMSDEEYQKRHFELAQIVCSRCEGTGIFQKTERKANFFGSPKYDVVSDLLDHYADHGRVIVSAGFTGTINHLTELIHSKGWEWIRCDGRGWATSWTNKATGDGLLNHFNSNFKDFPKLAMVGHPASIGAGLNLQVSKCIINVSNSFNAKDRIQLENRIHREGMDREHGGNIYDIYYLPSDEYVMMKVEIKRARQDMSMGLDVDMDEIESMFGVKE